MMTYQTDGGPVNAGLGGAAARTALVRVVGMG